MTVIIERRLYLDAKYLDCNIMKHLLSQLKEKTAEECSYEDGHILSVKRLVKIIDNYDQVFILRFEAETLKPKIGLEVSGVVCMVYDDGIFINIAERQKMLIPASTMEEYKFDEKSESYISKKRTIKLNDIVDAIVKGVKYNKQSFSCFGTLA